MKLTNESKFSLDEAAQNYWTMSTGSTGVHAQSWKGGNQKQPTTFEIELRLAFARAFRRLRASGVEKHGWINVL